MATIKIDGKTLTLDDAICKTDKSLRDALVTFFPAVANAKIKREKKPQGLVITITKQAGDKGLTGTVAKALDEATESINPILVLKQEGTRRTSKRRIDEILLEGTKEIEAVYRTVRNLDLSAHQPANKIPVGF